MAVSPDVISRRGLNRALLQRQFLLTRQHVSAYDAIEHLVGMQAQLPLDPYVGLWSRLSDFDPGELSTLLLDRRVARVALMRSTIHLVSARDCLALRPLTQIVQQRAFKSGFGRPVRDLDLTPVLAAGRELLEQAPRTRAQLRQLLAERWPDADPNSLAYAVTYLVPVVQITPRGVWGKSQQPTLTTVESWLGRPLDSNPAPEQLVLRYLAAFGPASVRDVQAWCGLTKLREVVEQLRGRLLVFRTEAGIELYDLPDAPRPDEDIPAPVRFLPVYDNVLLGHADRSRIVDNNRPSTSLFAGPDADYGGLLVDGFHAGLWKIDRSGDAARLRVQLLDRLPRGDRAAVEEEGQRLLVFSAAGARSRDVVFVNA